MFREELDSLENDVIWIKGSLQGRSKMHNHPENLGFALIYSLKPSLPHG